MIQCDGQIEMTDYLKLKIKSGTVKDLTTWINAKAKHSTRKSEKLSEMRMRDTRIQMNW